MTNFNKSEEVGGCDMIHKCFAPITAEVHEQGLLSRISDRKIHSEESQHEKENIDSVQTFHLHYVTFQW